MTNKHTIRYTFMIRQVLMPVTEFMLYACEIRHIFKLKCHQIITSCQNLNGVCELHKIVHIVIINI